MSCHKIDYLVLTCTYCTSLKVAKHSFAAVSSNSRDAVCFKLDKHIWRQKKQWYTEDDFSKSTHQNFVIFGRILTFIVF